MDPQPYADQAQRLAEQAGQLAAGLRAAGAAAAPALGGVEHAAGAAEPFIALFAVFLMACFVGYYVVWNVTPALHSPLMGVTNAISSVIVVGAMLATGFAFNAAAMAFGFLAVVLASVNIFGGFLVVGRMLAMFQARR